MLRGIFYPGLIAGVLAGLFMFLAQQSQLVPLVFEAEKYEDAQHALSQQTGPHAHEAGTQAHAHADGTPEWQPADGFERMAFSFLSNILTAIGFGVILAGVFALRAKDITWREGIVWGLAGYVSFHLAPAFGLPPDLPGMAVEINLGARQAWFLGTTAATAGGLALLGLANALWIRLGGIVLIVAPHVIGAPVNHVDTEVPAALAAQFVAGTLVITAVFWVVLGGLTGYFYHRLAAVRNAG